MAKSAYNNSFVENLNNLLVTVRNFTTTKAIHIIYCVNIDLLLFC